MDEEQETEQGIYEHEESELRMHEEQEGGYRVWPKSKREHTMEGRDEQARGLGMKGHAGASKRTRGHRKY